MTKIIAFNVNGIRAMLKKKILLEFINEEKPDIICLGETKITPPLTIVKEEIKEKLNEDYFQYWNSCKIKKGYSGTAIFTKTEPIKIIDDFDDEGRVIVCEFKKYFLIHVYTPNSGAVLARLNYRVNEWDRKFTELILHLQKTKPVIICGDLNVARNEIDLKNPKTNLNTAGYTIEERNSFEKLIEETKIIDSFRFLHPNTIKYSYWSSRTNARLSNSGWRIDYFLVDKKLIKKVIKSDILDNILGSDHAPVILELKN